MPNEDAASPYEALNESRNVNGTWLHNPCGSIILAAQVTHSVWDGPGISGHGEVQQQTVPYCPLCHEKPSPYGAAIRPGDKDWPKVPLRPKADAVSGRDAV